MVLFDHGLSKCIQHLAVLDGSHDLGVRMSACQILGEHRKLYLFSECALHVGCYFLKVLVDYKTCTSGKSAFANRLDVGLIRQNITNSTIVTLLDNLQGYQIK